MKTLLILFLICLGFEAKALCEKSMFGTYYFDYKDAQKDEFTFYFKSLEKCQEKEKWLLAVKEPIKICSCEPATRKKNFFFAPYLAGAVNKFLLYCHETNSKGLMSRNFIQSWSDETRNGDFLTSSKANLEACEKAKFEIEESYYKDKIKSHVEAHRPQQQEASR